MRCSRRPTMRSLLRKRADTELSKFGVIVSIAPPVIEELTIELASSFIYITSHALFA